MNETDLVSATLRTQETDTVNKVEPEKRQRDSQGRAHQQAKQEADTYERTSKEERRPAVQEGSEAEPAATPQPPGQTELQQEESVEQEPPRKHIDIKA